MDEGIRIRFEAKVDRSGGPGACHPWTATRDKKGYGRLHVGSQKFKTRKTVLASRVALELKLGRQIGPGMEALHRCPGGDNPACCNPEHLREGTHAENMRQMAELGRAGRATGERSGARTHPECVPRGEQTGRAVLTEEAVRAIRVRFPAEEAKVLAAEFGIGTRALYRVVRRERWGHVQ